MNGALRPLMIVCLLAGGAACAQTPAAPKNDLEFQQLKGSVRSVYAEMIVPGLMATGQKPGEYAPLTWYLETYSREGWLTEAISNVRGHLYSRRIVGRENGVRQVERDDTWYQPPNQRRQVVALDAEQRPATVETYAIGGELRGRTVYRWNGETMHELRYDGTGQLLSDTERTSKTGGDNGSSSLETYANGKLASREVAQSTAFGKRDEAVFYDGNDAVKRRDVQQDDGARRLSRTQLAEGTEVVAEREPQGKLVKQVVSEPDGRRVVYYYGPNGRRVKIEYYDAAERLESTITEAYVDDEHGNWINVTQTLLRPNTTPRVNAITTRTITYY